MTLEQREVCPQEIWLGRIKGNPEEYKKFSNLKSIRKYLSGKCPDCPYIAGMGGVERAVEHWCGEIGIDYLPKQ